ncbi:hypothetical protein [Nocardiopsis suaedae]|uniref:Uncharacterized protein n=1 Tax=Nocardiopsis suaedae TaxID=3018444 RepID=A0ABT4TLZ4_9ACTN|nr:hypothetical protein [Nocardiopsis suaedae]MDA2805724.1 hypothetical protein [Nocardiopsis suaedae]
MDQNAITDRLDHIRTTFERNVADLASATGPATPEAFVFPDEILSAATAGRCSECGEGHGIHLALRGGRIEWAAVQAHHEGCPTRRVPPDSAQQ